MTELIKQMQGEDWLPPEPEVPAPAYLDNSLDVRLDDLLRELNVLISDRPDDERCTVNNQYVPEWAKRDMSAVLGCLDCRRSILFWSFVIDQSLSVLVKQSLHSRTVDLTAAKEEHP